MPCNAFDKLVFIKHGWNSKQSFAEIWNAKEWKSSKKLLGQVPERRWQSLPGSSSEKSVTGRCPPWQACSIQTWRGRKKFENLYQRRKDGEIPSTAQVRKLPNRGFQLFIKKLKIISALKSWFQPSDWFYSMHRLLDLSR